MLCTAGNILLSYKLHDGFSFATFEGRVCSVDLIRKTANTPTRKFVERNYPKRFKILTHVS